MKGKNITLICAAFVVVSFSPIASADHNPVHDIVGGIPTEGGSASASTTCGLDRAEAEASGTKSATASASMYFQTDQGGDSDANDGTVDQWAEGSGGGSASAEAESHDGSSAWHSCDTTIVGQIEELLEKDLRADLSIGCSAGGEGGIAGDVVDAEGVYWVLGDGFAAPLGTLTADALSHAAPQTFEDTGLDVEYLFGENFCSAVLL